MVEVMDGSNLLHWKPNSQILRPTISVGLRTRLSTFISISVSASCSHQYSVLAGVSVSATSEELQEFRLALVSISP